MRARGLATLLLAASLLAANLGGCSPLSVEFTDHELDSILDMVFTSDPPADTSNAVADDADAAHLGQWLFFDARLSGDGEVRCATCHDPALAFADDAALSEGIGSTRRNAPTLLNVAWNRWQFWDGRADTPWAQALGPLENPDEHGGSRLLYAHVVTGDASLSAAYEAVFGPLPDLSDPGRFPAEGRPGDAAWDAMAPADQEAVNRVFADLGKALEAYERRLIQRGSPVDTFVAALRGDGPRRDLRALTDEEQRGLKLFAGDANCTRCHFGETLTNKEFHNLGLGARSWLPQDDYGRYVGIEDVLDDPFNGAGAFSDDPTGAPADKLRYLTNGTEQLGQYKTPSLRNVALTAPYMHGGQFDTLEEVLEFYSTLDETVQLGHREETLVPLTLSDDEVASLVAFLTALTGEPVDPSLTVAPESPLP